MCSVEGCLYRLLLCPWNSTSLRPPDPSGGQSLSCCRAHLNSPQSLLRSLTPPFSVGQLGTQAVPATVGSGGCGHCPHSEKAFRVSEREMDA